jgi:hypothetical protein
VRNRKKSEEGFLAVCGAAGSRVMQCLYFSVLLVVSLAQPAAQVAYGDNGMRSNVQAGQGAQLLSTPTGVAVNSVNVSVADEGNQRVVIFPIGMVNATGVVGQPNFMTAGVNSGGPATGLNGPSGVAAESANVLYVADSMNHRVLRVTNGVYDFVWGQGGMFTTNSPNSGGISATSLNSPTCAYVSGTLLYICDQQNNRVLVYTLSPPNATAFAVYGQGSFTSSNPAQGLTGLSGPFAVAVSPSGVFIADSANNRVTFYPGTQTSATVFYGQTGGAGNSSPNGGSGMPSATGLSDPRGVAVFSDGSLAISEFGNNRVGIYMPGNTTMALVLGQPNATTGSSNAGAGPTAQTLSQPWGIAVDGADTLFVADSGNQRVLSFSGVLLITTTTAPATTTGSTTTAAPTTTTTAAATTTTTAAQTTTTTAAATTTTTAAPTTTTTAAPTTTTTAAPTTTSVATTAPAATSVGAGQSSTIPSSTVPVSSTVSVLGSLTVVGSLTVAGALNVTGSVNVTGSLVISGSTSVASAATVTVGTLVITNPTATLQIVLPASAAPGRSVSVTVVQYDAVQGSFGNIQATGASCSASTSQVNYGSSSLTAVVAVSDCTGLSSGAIAGIAVSVIVVAVLGIVLTVVFARKARQKRDAKANSQLRQQDATHQMRQTTIEL